MRRILKYLLENPLYLFLKNHFFDRILEINRRYAKPRITMTPFAKLSLFFLRVYLLLLMGILFYKFFTLLR